MPQIEQAFISDQRKYRKMIIGQVDNVTTEKEQKRLARSAQVTSQQLLQNHLPSTEIQHHSQSLFEISSSFIKGRCN